MFLCSLIELVHQPAAPSIPENLGTMSQAARTEWIMQEYERIKKEAEATKELKARQSAQQKQVQPLKQQPLPSQSSSAKNTNLNSSSTFAATSTAKPVAKAASNKQKAGNTRRASICNTAHSSTSQSSTSLPPLPSIELAAVPISTVEGKDWYETTPLAHTMQFMNGPNAEELSNKVSHACMRYSMSCDVV
jgi:hypothetical protein